MKSWRELTKGQKALTIVGAIFAPVLAPAAVGVGLAAATTGAAVATGTVAAFPEVGVVAASEIYENCIY